MVFLRTTNAACLHITPRFLWLLDKMHFKG